MKFELFLNFNDGQARSAADFYASIFKSEVKDLMTYAAATNNPGFEVKESERDYLMYASVKIGDKDIMFMDMSSEWRVNVGGNIAPCVVIPTGDASHAEIERIAAELSADGGKVLDAPGKTFFSEYYAMVSDKFGITWHVYVE